MSRTSTASSSPRSGAAEPSAVPESPAAIRATLERIGLRPSRARGQSFLADPFVADAEAALVELPPGRPVLEVGGGLGILTAALRRRRIGPLTVVEYDPRLADFLAATFGAEVTVVRGDARRLPVPDVEAVVGNLPYAIATPLLVRYLQARVPRIVALLQREVAERLAAGPGSKSYGRLSILAALYGTVELYQVVPPSAFVPVPEVESRLLVHVARAGPLPVPSVAAFEGIVAALFSSRRKQLGNLLPRIATSRAEADSLARAADWPTDWATRRPEELPPDAYFALATAARGSHRMRG